jgi:flagellar motor switch protein FliN/FliY
MAPEKQRTKPMNAVSQNFDLLGEVSVNLSVELGRVEMPLKQVMGLAEESVVALDRLTDEMLDVMVNGKLIAKAEIIALENRFGLRIVELTNEAAASVAPLASMPMPEPFPAPSASPPAPSGQGTPETATASSAESASAPDAASIEGTDI